MFIISTLVFEKTSGHLSNILIPKVRSRFMIPGHTQLEQKEDIWLKINKCVSYVGLIKNGFL
jgi:hypothetical protein